MLMFILLYFYLTRNFKFSNLMLLFVRCQQKPVARFKQLDCIEFNCPESKLIRTVALYAFQRCLENT